MKNKDLTKTEIITRKLTTQELNGVKMDYMQRSMAANDVIEKNVVFFFAVTMINLIILAGWVLETFG